MLVVVGLGRRCLRLRSLCRVWYFLYLVFVGYFVVFGMGSVFLSR